MYQEVSEYEAESEEDESIYVGSEYYVVHEDDSMDNFIADDSESESDEYEEVKPKAQKKAAKPVTKPAPKKQQKPVKTKQEDPREKSDDIEIIPIPIDYKTMEKMQFDKIPEFVGSTDDTWITPLLHFIQTISFEEKDLDAYQLVLPILSLIS